MFVFGRASLRSARRRDLFLALRAGPRAPCRSRRIARFQLDQARHERPRARLVECDRGSVPVDGDDGSQPEDGVIDPGLRGEGTTLPRGQSGASRLSNWRASGGLDHT